MTYERRLVLARLATFTGARLHALCFHEVAAHRLYLGTGMVAIMGDLVGAFPKTWRELVVVLARLEAGVRGSRLVLLKDSLR